MRKVAFLLALAVAIGGLAPRLGAEQFSDRDRAWVLDMLQAVDADVRKYYYDPKLHGLDWDAKVREAKENIAKAGSAGFALSQVAALLDNLNDSHTVFLPPPRPYRHDYGFQMKMYGDHCLVSRVRPKSDAESKGIKPGDEVLSVNGFTVSRDILWKIQYVFGVLRPQPGLRLQLRDAAGKERQVDVMTHIEPLPRMLDLNGPGSSWNDERRESEDAERLSRARYSELPEGLLIVKVPVFAPDWSKAGSSVDPAAEFESIIGKARKHQALILDLRENPGGSSELLRIFLGGMMDHQVKIGDRVLRNDTKPITTQFHYADSFKGKLVVLVDNGSASASEVFARVVQLEKRGVILGDQTSGSVMEARLYDHATGLDSLKAFGASITQADLILADGKSLEHRGVTPDELLLPKPSDLASGRDPVLARAAEILGAKLTPEDAGKLFPYIWPKL